MDDLISRKLAMDALEWKWAGKAAMDAIKNLPPAQPEFDSGLYVDGFNDGYKQGKIDAQSEIIYCKDCRHFHYDMPYVIRGIPVLGHEVCDFWGDGCKTSENGFCSFAERKPDE